MEKCVNHPDRDAKFKCEGCGKPLCADCVEAREEDMAFCYDCAVERQLSEFGEKGEAAEKAALAEEKTRKVGSRSFTIVAVVLAVLILGGAGFVVYERVTQGGSTVEASLDQEMVWERDECMLSMQQVREALAEYYHDHDGYPSSLKDLDDVYLEAEAVCPVSGAPYEYARTVGSYELACPNPAEHGVESITADAYEIPHYEGTKSPGGE